MTWTPTNTQVPQNQKSKGDGWYLVNSEIAPGLWRSTSGNTGCYWERDKDLNHNLNSILGNYFGLSGGLIDIQSTDVIIEFNGCGTWTYIQNTPKVLQPNAYNPHGDGAYMVGVDIAPGTWRTQSGTSSCYWERDRDATGALSDIINNDFGVGGGFITIASTDLQLQIQGCGSTTYISP